ncbi:helix-turn-helix transcriptional regulator [Sinorhizobium fredii]|uniref:helix-turn-helix transcriptional regulator n=1 Tax=Rhizobium fredii TaxID=380 RepID=UPI0004ACC4B8|nr:helix-turn-helix transcriptional regulator [Sinorhizobium fredii]
MTLGRYTELPHLADLNAGIEAVWLSVSSREDTYRVLPDGRCDIILKFTIKRRPISELTPIVTGPTTGFYDVPLEPGTGFVGVRLRPGYFQKILGLEPLQLRGGGLVGDAALDLCPGLKALCTPALDEEELVDRLVRFVHKRYAESDFEVALLSRNIMSALHASGGRLRIADVASMHGVCERTARRVLHRAIGLSPKAFASVIQFHRALRLLRDHRLSLADAALEAGFADQSHMCRVFQRMGGFSPARLPEVTLVTISD